MQMDPFTHIIGTQTAQKKAFSGHFWTNFETEVRHLRIPLPVATVEFLAQTLYFTPIGIMHQNFNQIQSTTTEV